jgi:hypothetical protein
MWKRFALAACGLWSTVAHAELTDIENRWLRAGLPVLGYAKEQGLPVDIVVQPQATAGAAPLAMGYVDGRCKLVLSMRGNPQVEATVDAADAALRPLVIEAMFAHELGHCWRYVQGRWHGLPAGFTLDAEATVEDDRARLLREMRATRREEGYADLVGLAWTLRRHPAQYGRVQAWLEQVRASQPVPGSHHDTLAWVRLAAQPSAFAAAESPFEEAAALWESGLP